MHSRRGFIAGALGFIGASSLSVAASAEQLPPSDLFEDLPVLAGCRVVHVAPVLAGAVPLVLEGPSGLFQVDVCRLGKTGARGMASNRSLEFFVHNGGRGDRQSSPEQIRAVRALAEELDRRELAGARVPELSNWVERQELVTGSGLEIEVVSSYVNERERTRPNRSA
jgi:hypothetical protein